MSTEPTTRAKSAKQWSVSTASTGSEPLRMFVAGKPLTQSAPATVDGVSPVEHLLLSIATCFALSCRAVLMARKLLPLEFEVAVSGVKAADPPSRLESLQLVIAFGEGLSETAAGEVAAAAKKLCTVTNTLGALPLSIEIETREP
jgi:uncharacterized OsmC-like protein